MDLAICDGVSDCPDTLALCAEAGWPAKAHGDEVMIPLEVDNAFFQAVVHRDGHGQLVLHVEVGRVSAVSDVCRRAIELLQRMIARGVSMVRTGTRNMGGIISCYLEVAVPIAVRPVQWAEALSALSVACDLCWREVEALREDEIARAYLNAQCWLKRVHCPVGRKEREHDSGK